MLKLDCIFFKHDKDIYTGVDNAADRSKIKLQCGRSL